MKRVFISHRNGEDEVTSLVSDISTFLSARSFDVLLDLERLKPGAKWRDEIYSWLNICHIGLIVISPSVLAGDNFWVARESSILMWRRTLDPSFIIIPILTAPVIPEDLLGDKLFSDIGLHELQVIMHEGNTTQTIKEITSQIGHLTQLKKTPTEELAEQIEVLLTPIHQDFLEHAIKLVCGDVDVPGFTNKSGLLLSYLLLQYPLSQTFKVLEYLMPRVVNQSDIERILDIIAPSWVDLTAARWVAQCAKAETPRPAIVVNAKTLYTAQMYVQRASSRPPKTMWRLISVTNIQGENRFEDLAIEINHALENEFATALLDDPFIENNEDQLRELLQELEMRGHPVIVVTLLPSSAASLIPDLQERFPHITFLFLSGEELPDEDLCPGRLLKRVIPELTNGLEQAARKDFIAARSILRQGS